MQTKLRNSIKTGLLTLVLIMISPKIHAQALDPAIVITLDAPIVALRGSQGAVLAILRDGAYEIRDMVPKFLPTTPLLGAKVVRDDPTFTGVAMLSASNSQFRIKVRPKDSLARIIPLTGTIRTANVRTNDPKLTIQLDQPLQVTQSGRYAPMIRPQILAIALDGNYIYVLYAPQLPNRVAVVGRFIRQADNTIRRRDDIRLLLPKSIHATHQLAVSGSRIWLAGPESIVVEYSTTGTTRTPTSTWEPAPFPDYGCDNVYFRLCGEGCRSYDCGALDSTNLRFNMRIPGAWYSSCGKTGHMCSTGTSGHACERKSIWLWYRNCNGVDNNLAIESCCEAELDW